MNLNRELRWGFDRLSPQLDRPARKLDRLARKLEGSARSIKTFPRERCSIRLKQSGGRIGEFDCVGGQVAHDFAATDTDHTCAGMELPSSPDAAHPIGIDAA